MSPPVGVQSGPWRARLASGITLGDLTFQSFIADYETTAAGRRHCPASAFDGSLKIAVHADNTDLTLASRDLYSARALSAVAISTATKRARLFGCICATRSMSALITVPIMA